MNDFILKELVSKQNEYINYLTNELYKYNKKCIENKLKYEIEKLSNYEYIFINYKQCSKFELSNLLSLSEITRLIFLSTYISYDNKLVFDNGIAITKKNANKILKLSDNKYRDFINKLIKHNIVFDAYGSMYINEKFIFKKEINSIINNHNTTRVFTKKIRSLYNNSNVNKHKQLGYIFLLIPYINKYHNIICWNQDEYDFNNMEIMKYKDISKILGIHEVGFSRLINDLLKIDHSIINKNNKRIIINKDLIMHIIKDEFKISKGETRILKYLHENNIFFNREKFYNDLLGLNKGHLRYDFYLPDYNLLIEYQGQQHEKYIPGFHKSKEDFKRQQEHDRLKYEYAAINNIDLLEIWYYNFDNIEKILDEKLKINKSA